MPGSTKLLQFAVNFPYSQLTLEYYKRAIQIGKKDLSIILPKIPQIETRIYNKNPVDVYTTRNGDTNTQAAYNTSVRRGIIALADDQGFRDKFRAGLPMGLGLFTNVDNSYNTEEFNTENSKYPKPDAEIKGGKITPHDDLLIRHFWKPMYIKTVNPQLTGTVLANYGSDTTSEATQAVLNSLAKCHSYAPDASDGNHAEAFYNEKKMPMQLWDPYLYLGVITGHANEGYRVEFNIEYSYDQVAGTDYFYREKGWVNESTLQSIYKNEPSKLYYVNGGTIKGDEYTGQAFIKTQRLRIYETITDEVIADETAQPTPTPAYMLTSSTEHENRFKFLKPEVLVDTVATIEQMQPNPFDIELPNPF